MITENICEVMVIIKSIIKVMMIMMIIKSVIKVMMIIIVVEFNSV